MEQIVVDQYLILLDDKPLSLITQSGLARWENDGVTFRYRFDEVTHEGDHLGKFRCLYEKEGSPEVFVLVEPPSSPEGFQVILFDHPTHRLN